MQVATLPENSRALNNAVDRSDAALWIAYRASFSEYSRKLDALQRLTGDGSIDAGQIEAALLEVEKARMAHSCARDRLATELVRSSFPPGRPAARRIDEDRIRETAQLVWELAGRPAGTAERDWRLAERLVHSAAGSRCS
jgi:hypothetical protein